MSNDGRPVFPIDGIERNATVQVHRGGALECVVSGSWGAAAAELRNPQEDWEGVVVTVRLEGDQVLRLLLETEDPWEPPPPPPPVDLALVLSPRTADE